MGTLVRMGVMAGVGSLLYKFLRKKGEENNAAPVYSSGVVRDAGPTQSDAQRQRGWDKVDEQVDESFPASDPPTNY